MISVGTCQHTPALPVSVDVARDGVSNSDKSGVCDAM